MMEVKRKGWQDAEGKARLEEREIPSGHHPKKTRNQPPENMRGSPGSSGGGPAR
jgi:hypothetical protein